MQNLDKMHTIEKEVNHMKKIFTFVLAAIIAISFSVVGFAQDKPAEGKDKAATSAPAPEKKAPAKKKSTKSKKPAKTEKKEEAPAAAAAPAPAK
jgi:hypothetical protein